MGRVRTYLLLEHHGVMLLFLGLSMEQLGVLLLL